ncbi:MAG TPA: hypothetical protein PLD27_04000 [bacterium]|nr:hypothetical protein [bacterium]HOL47792.1 hypothetical protein [bacterium]HPQ18627.1 hypothetical protein [bacterium]
MSPEKDIFIQDMENQRKQIIEYYNLLKTNNYNISIEQAALEWIYKFANSWRITHNLNI